MGSAAQAVTPSTGMGRRLDGHFRRGLKGLSLPLCVSLRLCSSVFLVHTCPECASSFFLCRSLLCTVKQAACTSSTSTPFARREPCLGDWSADSSCRRHRVGHARAAPLSLFFHPCDSAPSWRCRPRVPKNCSRSEDCKQRCAAYLQADEKQMLEASRKRSPGSP